ncbi:MAG: TIGR04219 family outer membrane beta-barrel protein [Acinetobacter sp.]|nr:TIGR04219 family outer membrane beta-barrel protein [Acinetobacter sp.]
MKQWQPIAIAMLATTMASVSHADVIGVKASADYWHVQGDVNQAASNSNFNTANEQSLEKKGTAQLALSVEHPVPLIPNAAIRHTSIKQNAELNNTAVNEIKLDNTDYILYYEILDNIVSADVGIAAKRLDGHVANLSTGAKAEISETLPMLYAAAGAKLPFTGWRVNAQALATKYNDVKATDALAEVKYNFVDNAIVDIGAKAGYRILDVQLDKENGTQHKMKFHGPFVGFEAHF